MIGDMKKIMISILCISALLTTSAGVLAAVQHSADNCVDTYGAPTWDDSDIDHNIDPEDYNGMYEAMVNGIKYTTLEEALEAAMGTDATVILLKDCTLMHTIVITEGTHLKLDLNNFILTCEETLFQVENVNAELTINTGMGMVIAPGVIYNPYIPSNESHTFNAYISGSFVCSGKAFVFEDAHEIYFEYANINSVDSAIWCNHLGCDTLCILGSNIAVTGDLPTAAAIRAVARELTYFSDTNVDCKSSSAVECVSALTYFFYCNFTAGAFNIHLDEDGYWTDLPQATVVISNVGCEEIGLSEMHFLFAFCSLGYNKSTLNFPPIFIAAENNCCKIIDVVCGDLSDDCGAMIIFKEGTDASVWFNGKEHKL